MKTRSLLLVLVTALLAGTAGWWAASRKAPASPESARPATGTDGRRILYYQSAMHPWIRSERPGKCTICGMDLTPVFEGDAGFRIDSGWVTLGTNSIQVLDVRTTEVARRPLARTLRVAGTIEEDDSRHRILSAYVAGRVEDLHIAYVGAEVRAGEPLARFYSPMLLEAERQFLAVVRSPISDAQGAPGLPGEHRLLRDAAAQRLRQLGLTDPQIEALPSKDPTNHFVELLAPVSGTVVERFVYAGQYVMEGEKLFEIADLSTLWFRFDAYEQDLPWLQPGQTVDVTTPSVPGRTFQAPIRFIDPTLVEMTRSAKVRVELTNPPVELPSGSGRLLRPRLYAEGRVHLATPDALVVPRTAVLSPAGTPVVYVDHGSGAYEQRRLRLGRTGDTDYEVLSGLTEGERVVVAGNLMIDAQAQLNQVIDAASHGSPGSNQVHAPHTDKPDNPLRPALEADAAERITHLLAAADALRAALAADDLAAFRAAAGRFPAAAESATRVLPADSELTGPLASVGNASRLPEAADLRGARRTFHPLSNALVALVRELRRTEPAFRDLLVYQCPMTAEAFDGAPSRAQWFQLAPPLRNPWFGAEMLDCGTVVRP